MKRILLALCAVLLTALILAPSRADEPKKPAAEDEGQTLVFLADSRPVLLRVHVTIGGKPLLKAWNAFIDDIFDRADVNKDGVLDKNEMTRIPAPQELFGASNRFFFGGSGLGSFGGQSGQLGGTDGKVTRRDLADYYRKNGGAPLQLVQAGNNQMMYRRQLLDLNGQMPTLGQADALNKALFALLDTDRDGKLSRKELEAAPAVLLRRDVDDDEMITPAELQQQQQANTGYDIVFTGTAPMTPLSADSPLLMADAREPSRALAEALLKRYARSEEARKTGKLTAKDLGLDAETFRKLDRDSNGTLDREELAHFARRTPDAELTIEADGGKLADLKLIGKASDFIEKGLAPSLAIGNTVLVLSLGNDNTGQVWAQPAVVEEESLYKMQFAAADGDNNGYLDMNEARRNGFFASNFKAMDADGDGKLYLKEVLAWVRSRKELRDKVKASCATLSFNDQGRGLFDLLDTDGDGRLSVREMRQAAKLLLKLDRDGDGCLSPSEIPRRYQLGAQRGTGGGDGIGGVAVFTAWGTRVAPQPERAAGPLWFRKMDRNRDGDVSRREFLGTDEQFRLIDKDGDGLISVKEAEEFEAAQRKKK